MITVGEAIQAFLLACQAEGKRPRTVQWYENILRHFSPRVAALPLNEVKVDAIREYLSLIRTQKNTYAGKDQTGLNHETIRGHIRCLRRFFNWCSDEYNLDPVWNPMRRIKMPSRSNHPPKAIALDDLKRLLQATDNTIMGKRDRAMLIFLADTGCRAGGMLSLTLENLNLDQGRAIVNEKGDRTRVVPFTRYTAQILKEWLAVRPQKADNMVFCSLKLSCIGNVLTVNGLNQVIKRLKKKANVKGRCNPHSFRHGFAREYLQNGGDLATLARLMGHTDVSVTTAFYAVFTDNELAARHELFSPIKNLME